MIIKLFDNPFDLKSVELIEVSNEYKTVQRFFDENFKDKNYYDYICSVSGGNVDWDYYPTADDEILFIRIVRGSNGGIFTAILGVALIVGGLFTGGTSTALGMGLLASGAGMLLSSVASLFMKTPTANMDNSATYAWEGIQNIIGEGSPLPVVYGEHRVGGVIVEGYLDGINYNGVSDQNYLYLVSVVSEGPVQAVFDETAKINGKSVWMYSSDEAAIEQFFNFKTNALEEVAGVINNSRSAVKAETISSNVIGDDNGNGDVDSDNQASDSDDTDSSEQGNSGYGK